MPGVAAGDVVHRGQQVGVLAPAPVHCAPLTCLHWGVRRGQAYLDPLVLLRPPAPPVLLPLEGWPVIRPVTWPALAAPPPARTAPVARWASRAV